MPSALAQATPFATPPALSLRLYAAHSGFRSAGERRLDEWTGPGGLLPAADGGSVRGPSWARAGAGR